MSQKSPNQRLMSGLALASGLAIFWIVRQRTPPVIPDPPPVQTIAGWGELFDPLKDCDVRPEKERVAIVVPGTLHDLSVEQGKLDAPRIVKEARGDFVAQIRIGGKVRPGGDRTSGYALPYQGAGLLAWADSNDYVRFERSAILRGTQLITYVNLEQRRKGRMTQSQPVSIPDEPILLRLERRSDRLLASFSPDGRRWTPLPEMDVAFGPSVRVGVVAINTSTEPFTAEFEELRIDPGGKPGKADAAK